MPEGGKAAEQGKTTAVHRADINRFFSPTTNLMACLSVVSSGYILAF